MPSSPISFVAEGQGEPLVLIHGGIFANWFVPLADSEALRRFHVIRVRRAGYESTPPPPPAPLHIAGHARHVAALLGSLELPPAHIAGHSSGALIALQLAADFPHLVRSLTLMEPAPLGPFRVPAFDPIAQQVVAPAMGAFAAGDVPGAVATFMSGICRPDFRDVIQNTLGPDAYPDVLREAPFFFADEIPAAMQWMFTAADAARVVCPVLVMEGADGRLKGDLSRQVTNAALRLFPKASFALIENAAHMLPLENVEGIASALAGFLGDGEKSAAHAAS